MTEHEVSLLVSIGVDLLENSRPEVKPALVTRENRYQHGDVQSNEAADLWMERFSQLKSYKDRFGNCNVPRDWLENKPLGGWVKAQRYNFRNNQLFPERLALLQEIGFEFVAPKKMTSWEDSFKMLIEYKNNYGTLDIDIDNAEYQTLRGWLHNQATKMRKGELENNKVRLLNEIGFDAGLKRGVVSWEDRYVELKAYYKENGHCDVPQHFGGTTGLGKWVNRQRQAYVDGRLDENKIQLLNGIHFIWKKNRGQKTLEKLIKEGS